MTAGVQAGPSGAPLGSGASSLTLSQAGSPVGHPTRRSGATLGQLAAAVDGAVVGGGDIIVTDATHDSRQVRPGMLFCAVRGSTTDGHDHAPQAVRDGAAALLVERELDLGVPQLIVPDVRAALGPVASEIHGRPSERLTVVGVTGTNGKTTTAYLLEAAFAAAGRGAGVIGTVETRIHGRAQPGVRTTPEGTDLQRLLALMYDRGVDAVAMEVSSHGLDLRRVDGTRFAVAVFTNLSQDHLDWHGTMEAYFSSKARLFEAGRAERGLVSVDDDWGRRLARQVGVAVETFGRHETADHRIVDIETDVTGGRARLADGPEVRTRLLGEFNVRNAVAAYLAAIAAGVPPGAAVEGIAACPGVPGRLERVPGGAGATVLVDYAHSPDAVERVVAAMRQVLGNDGRLHLVIGAGGDRDRAKRPQMGAVAAAADRAVLTSDNPRSEDPAAILAAVEEGARQAVAAGAPAEIVIRQDRREAIAEAVRGAAPGDIVVIAGKGHETGQEFADHTVPFDDRIVAAEILGSGGSA